LTEEGGRLWTAVESLFSAAFRRSQLVQLLSLAVEMGAIQMVAPQAMRMVWLALCCLIGVATVAVLKIAVSRADLSRAVPTAKAEALRQPTLTGAVALSSENPASGTQLQNSPSTRTDKPEVSKEAAPDVKPVASIAIELPTAEPKQLSKPTGRIVIRHWHDPLDKRTAAAQPTAKGKLSKRARSAEASIAPSTEMPSRER
jgi:hypothetical protein